MRTTLLALACFVLIVCLAPGGVSGQGLTTARDRAARAEVNDLSRTLNTLLPRVASLESENARLRRQVRTLETRFDQWRRSQLEPVARPEGEEARVPRSIGQPGLVLRAPWW